MLVITGLQAQTTIFESLETYFGAESIRKAQQQNATYAWSSNERTTLLYLNLARSHPRQFAAFFRSYLREHQPEAYTDKFLKNDRYYATFYRELLQLDPLPVLVPDASMQTLAICWAEESGQSGAIGHERTNCAFGYQAESTCFSYTDDPLFNLLELLVDEGVLDLGHRKMLLNPDLRSVGIAVRPHVRYNHCLVIDLAGEDWIVSTK